MEEVKIKSEYIKLDQFLKYTGIASTGGEAKIYIAEGEVKVNGETIKQRGKKIYKNDIIEFNEMKYIVI